MRESLLVSVRVSACTYMRICQVMGGFYSFFSDTRRGPTLAINKNGPVMYLCSGKFSAFFNVEPALRKHTVYLTGARDTSTYRLYSNSIVVSTW